MISIDLSSAIYEAWYAYGSKKTIVDISDISAKVSTNLVYRVALSNGSSVIAKASYFGEYDNFVHDHSVINILSNNLLYPFENFIGKSLLKDGKVFIHKTSIMNTTVWVVFYNPIRTDCFFPKILTHQQIESFGKEMAKFHYACADAMEQLPPANKTMRSDIIDFYEKLSNKDSIEHFYLKGHIDEVKLHCTTFLENTEKLKTSTLTKIPVFIDWNIGNFSITKDNDFFSRWDYDWFRIAPRVLDFYFCSRVVSKLGDKTIFSYTTHSMKDERFIIFLKAYHEVYPLSEKDILFLKEAYRFFILNYVIHHGKRFFQEFYSTLLIKEALSSYLPTLDKDFNPEDILHKLALS